MYSMFAVQFEDGTFAINTPIWGWAYTTRLEDATLILLREDAEDVIMRRFNFKGEVVVVNISGEQRSLVSTGKPSIDTPKIN